LGRIFIPKLAGLWQDNWVVAYEKGGGEGGIRTHGTLSGTPDFESAFAALIVRQLRSLLFLFRVFCRNKTMFGDA